MNTAHINAYRAFKLECQYQNAHCRDWLAAIGWPAAFDAPGDELRD
jgi:hypothetical protein